MRSKHNEMGQFATGCPPFDKEVYGPIWERGAKNGGERSVKMVGCRAGEPRTGYDETNANRLAARCPFASNSDRH